MRSANEAHKLLSDRLGKIQPSVAIILGSGFGVELDTVHWKFGPSEIPGAAIPTVDGHSGCISAGLMGRHEILLMQGRIHYYEGISFEDVTFQVRLVHELGIRKIIFISAAGGICEQLDPGSIMLVKDHVCAQSLPATRIRGTVYDTLWRERVLAVSDGLPISCGVFVWIMGPSYETPAEIVALGRRGGDAVGMSLVPEALEASAMDMHVLAAAVITNRAAGLQKRELCHEDVLHAASSAHTNLMNFLAAALDQAPS